MRDFALIGYATNLINGSQKKKQFFIDQRTSLIDLLSGCVGVCHDQKSFVAGHD